MDRKVPFNAAQFKPRLRQPDGSSHTKAIDFES